MLARFAAVRAPILALTASDDPARQRSAAVQRALAYFTGAERRFGLLHPDDLGVASIGHFALFHDRFAESFWPGTLCWIAEGRPSWDATPEGAKSA